MVLLRDVSPYGPIKLEYDKSSCFGSQKREKECRKNYSDRK